MSAESLSTEEKPAKLELLNPYDESSAPTPVSILQLAVDRGANVETLAKLLELQERYEANQARKAFDAAFAAFKSEAPKLEKTKEVAFGPNKPAAYKYTPLDEIAAKLAPFLNKHGFSYNWRQDSDKECITVTCILRHAQGHYIENSLSASPDPSGSKNAIQAVGSAVSYLRRYTLLGALGMATSDEDMDGVTMDEAADFLALIKESRTLDELKKNYDDAVRDALKPNRNPKSAGKAVELFKTAMLSRRRELSA